MVIISISTLSLLSHSICMSIDAHLLGTAGIMIILFIAFTASFQNIKSVKNVQLYTMIDYYRPTLKQDVEELAFILTCIMFKEI